ncbi:MAG: hypothetical protein HUJ73_03000 [Eubacterium sp.]|nr:hypothetical protein [Eubacterium sp.]
MDKEIKKEIENEEIRKVDIDEMQKVTGGVGPAITNGHKIPGMPHSNGTGTIDPYVPFV